MNYYIVRHLKEEGDKNSNGDLRAWLIRYDIPFEEGFSTIRVRGIYPPKSGQLTHYLSSNEFAYIRETP